MENEQFRTVVREELQREERQLLEKIIPHVKAIRVRFRRVPESSQEGLLEVYEQDETSNGVNGENSENK